MRRLTKVAVLLAAMTGFTGSAWALSDVDSLTVIIRPDAYYAVEIATDDISLDLGTVALAASTQTVVPSTVTIKSTWAQTDLRLRGNITSGGTPWQFETSSNTVQPNYIAAWGTFTSVARSSAPIQEGDHFSGTAPGANGSDMIDGTNRYVGTASGVDDLFEVASGFAAKNMDALPPDPDANAKSHLWLYFRLPSASSSSNAQNISVILTAGAPVN